MSSSDDSSSDGASSRPSTPPSSFSPRSPRSRLCGYCDTIPFGRYLGEEITQAISLGRWADIRASQTCPFCRLVTHALTIDPRQTPSSGSSRLWLKNELSWKLGIELSPYDRSKSLSYSNKFDLRSKAKESLDDAFRFIVEVEESSKSDKGSARSRKQAQIQYLAHREKFNRDRQFFGRKVDAKNVDIELLNSWLDRCSKWHFEDCQSDGDFDDELLANLRLIDTRKECIIKVNANDFPDFVALSYVWGKEEMWRATKMRPVGLMRKDIICTEDGEATPLPAKLPRTIKDAVTLTEQLGYRYLWVDALCIVQDVTFDEKLPHLTNMKAIYNCSSLTIAAAAGEHADHGLPGISVPRRHNQYSEVVRGLRLAVMSPSFSKLENSSRLLWNTRGWTFQEKLLSRRLLLFTDYQVYYKCSDSIWTEEVVMETEQISKSVETRQAKYRWQPGRSRHGPSRHTTLWKTINPRLQVADDWNYLGAFLDYASAIQEYTKRSITDPRDALFAIDGVLDTMDSQTHGFTMGLPRKHFLEALLWYPDLGSRCFYNSDGQLPTWSWAAYTFEGRGATFDLMDVRQMRDIISIATQRFKKKEALDSESAEGSSNKSSDDPDPFKLTGTFANLLSCLSWSLLRKDNTIRRLYYSDGQALEKIAFDIPAQALQIGKGFAGVLVQQAINYGQTSTENWRPSRRDLPDRPHILAFKTVIVRYRIGKPIYEKITDAPEEVGVFELVNSHDQCVGEVTTTYQRAFRSRNKEDLLTVSWGLALRNAVVHKSYLPKWRFYSEGGKSFNPLTKIWKDETKEGATLRGAQEGMMELPYSLVRRWGHYLPKKLLLPLETPQEQMEEKEKTLFDEVYMAKQNEPRPRSLWSVVNLILVDWQGDVALRAGVGRVLMTAWQEDWTSPERVFLG